MTRLRFWALAGGACGLISSSAQAQSGGVAGAPVRRASHACTGQETAAFPNCKLGLTTALPRGCRTDKNRNDARTTEFEARIGPFIKTASVRDRVVSAATMTVLCGVSLGSCGRAVEKIFEYAQVPLPALQGLGVSTTQAMHEKILSCPTSDRACRAGIRPWLRQLVDVQQRAWVERLQPGDRIQVYTGVIASPGSSAVYGMHATLFVGWEDAAAKKWAKVIQGQFGHVVSEGRTCLGVNCGNNRSIMTGHGPLAPE